MKILVDQKPIDPENISYNSGLNYGLFDSKKIEVHNYSFFIEKQAFLEAFADIYQETMLEIKADDKACNDNSSFRETGYTSLAEAFEFPNSLAKTIDTYFDREIFDYYLPNPKGCTYIINSTDLITVSNHGILIEGRCFNLEAAVGRRPECVPGGV